MDLPLSLKAKISRLYLSKFTLALLLCAWSLSTLLYFLSLKVSQTKSNLNSECHALEVATNALASTPRYTAIAMTRQLQQSVDYAQKNAGEALKFSIELSKQVLIYLLKRYQKVTLCLVTMSVQSSLGLVSDNAKEITEFVNARMENLHQTINKGFDGINNVLTGINNNIPSMGPLGKIDIGLSKVIPVSIPGLDTEMKWSLPEGSINTLQNVGKVDVSLDRLHDEMAKFVSIPFDELKAFVDGNITIARIKIDETRLPEPVIAIKFCDHILPLKLVDQIYEEIVRGVIISFIGLGVVFVIYWLLAAYIESIMHKYELMGLESAKNELGFSAAPMFTVRLNNQSAINKIFVAIKYPLLFRLSNSRWLLVKSTESRKNWLWILAYISHTYAWFCMMIGAVGIIFLRLHLVVIKWVFAKLEPIIAQELKSSMKTASEAVSNLVLSAAGPFVKSINDAASKAEIAIKNSIVGNIETILQTVTSKLDTILTAFQSAVSDLLKPVPILEKAIDSFYTCVVGNISVTITQMGDQLRKHANITLPTIAESDLGLDGKALLDTMHLSDKLNLLKDNGTELLFAQQINELQDSYMAFIAFQQWPFVIIFSLGFSLLIFGILTLLFERLRIKHDK